MKKKDKTIFVSSFGRIVEEYPGVLEVEMSDGKIVFMTLDHKPFFVSNDPYFVMCNHLENNLCQIVECDKKQNCRKIYLYSLDQKKLIVDAKIIKEGIFSDDVKSIFCIEDAKTGKLQLLNPRRILSHPKEFLQKYDSIQPFAYDSCVVSQNGRFGIYSLEGMQTKLDFDKISTIDKQSKDLKLEKNGYCYYYVNDYLNPFSYDTIHSIHPLFAIAKHDSSIDLIDRDNGQIMISISADNLSCLGNSFRCYPDTAYLFSYEKDKKKGVFCLRKKWLEDSEICWEREDVCELGLDSVSAFPDVPGAILLEKERKFGFLYEDKFRNYVIIPQFNKIEHFFDAYFGFFEKELCNVYDASRQITVLSQCQIKDFGKQFLIFQNEDGYGLMRKNNLELSGNQRIEHLGNQFFRVINDDRQKLFGFGKYLSNDEYEQINICPKCRQTSNSSANSIYFAMKAQDGWHLMAVNLYHDSIFTSLHDVFSDTVYSDILFLDDMVILHSNSSYHTLVDYHERKIGITSGNIDCISSDDGKEKVYTDGNQVFLFHAELDTFFKTGIVMEQPLYTAMYEGKNGTVIVNTFDKEEYLNTCQKIEKISDDEFELILQRLNHSSSLVQGEPPILIKSKKNLCL